MTKEQLQRFIGRAIKFTIGGLSFVGTVHYNAWRDGFRIIYSFVEEGRARNEDFALSSDLISRITFDPDQNILKLF